MEVCERKRRSDGAKPTRKRARRSTQTSSPPPDPTGVKPFPHRYGTRSATGARLGGAVGVAVSSEAGCERKKNAAKLQSLEKDKTNNAGSQELTPSLACPGGNIQPRLSGRASCCDCEQPSRAENLIGHERKVLTVALSNPNRKLDLAKNDRVITTSSTELITGRVGESPHDAPAKGPAAPATTMKGNPLCVDSAEVSLTHCSLAALPPVGREALADRQRARSRLSLRRRRPLPATDLGKCTDGEATQAGDTAVNARKGCSSNSPFKQQVGAAVGLNQAFPPTTSTNQKYCRADSDLANPSISTKHILVREVNNSRCADDDADMPPGPASPGSMSPRPAPYVGLTNLGNTCYVNTVVQALLACPEVAAKLRTIDFRQLSLPTTDKETLQENSAAACDFSTIRQQLAEHQHPVQELRRLCDLAIKLEPEVPSATTATNVKLADTTARNPLLDALAALLIQMDDHNRELANREWASNTTDGCNRSECGESQMSSTLRALAPSIERSGVAEVNLKTVLCKNLAGQGALMAPSESGSPTTSTNPPNRIPESTGGSELRREVLMPTALVEFIRDGLLDSGYGASADGFGWNNGGHRCNRRVGSNASLPSFASGQQCVSELLGMILSIDDDPVAAENETRSGPDVSGTLELERRSESAGTSAGIGLGLEFRGALCVRTLCTECERDRVSREPFTELVLPPLLQSRPPSTETKTVKSLVESVLGNESLGGTNKVWCETCRQWTEAQRRSSLHTLPRLLCLHIRPGTTMEGGRASSHTSPPAEAFRPNTELGAFPHGPLKAIYAGRSCNGALIDSTLCVSASLTCNFHGSTSEVPRAGLREDSSDVEGQKPSRSDVSTNDKGPVKLEQEQQCGDVWYDLVGVILHKGSTLVSGHYTFALNTWCTTDKGRRSVEAVSAAWTGVSDESRDTTSFTEQAIDGKSERLANNGLAGEPPKATKEAAGVKDAGRSGGPSQYDGGDEAAQFVLFDDDCVRWLSSEERDIVLRGGGNRGGESCSGLGDAFLVFYSRRENSRS